VAVVDPSLWKKIKLEKGYHCVKGVPFSLTSVISTAFHREEPFHEKLKKLRSAG